MRRAALLLFFCLVSAAPGLALARPAKTPVVVELFTAQGCATCGKANTLIASLADRPGVVALTWSVDYWDYTGWKDTFARPEFGDRQRAYERRFGLRDVYTPQVVVGGAAEGPGAKPQAVEALIQKWRRPLHPPTIRIARGRVSVGAARAPGSADVWLIRYDPREQDVEVKDGDNRGHTVVQRNVVRDLVRLGGWRGRYTAWKLPAPTDDGLETLIVVQGVRGGRIFAAYRAPGQ